MNEQCWKYTSMVFTTIQYYNNTPCRLVEKFIYNNSLIIYDIQPFYKSLIKGYQNNFAFIDKNHFA